MLDVLDKNGFVINPGNHEQMVFDYKKELIKVRESRIKEWDFYQFQNFDYLIQLTIGHATLFDSCGFAIVNLKTGERIEHTDLSLHTKNKIRYEKDPSKEHVLEYKNKNFYIGFKLKGSTRTLECRGEDKKLGKFDLQVQIPNNSGNEKMVILTPFYESKKMFYLNYKENYFDAKIAFRSSKVNINLDNIHGLIDSGRGYWPFKHQWYWGNASFVVDSRKIGWNIGFGFGDLSHGNENYFFFDGKAHKIEIQFDMKNHPTGTIALKSNDGSIKIELEPYYNNHTETKVLWINNSCDQVFYKTKGFVIVDEKKYSFENQISFIEHCKNQW